MVRHNLYMFRCENKLTKGGMAKRTGVSRTTYTNIESGKRLGTKSFWDNLQREFNIPDEKMYSLIKTEEGTGRCEANEK